MDKKYELTSDSIKVNGHTLYRIKARRSFSGVKIGDLGGFIESEDNLSHEGDCWVYSLSEVGGVVKYTMVYGNARVCDDARVYDSACIFDNAQLCGDARVYDNAQVYGDAHISGEAWVDENVRVFGQARMSGYASATDDSRIYGNAQMFGNVQVSWNAQVCGDVYISTSDWAFIRSYTKLDHGVWTQYIEIDGKSYLLSPTLEKLLLR